MPPMSPEGAIRPRPRIAAASRAAAAPPRRSPRRTRRRGIPRTAWVYTAAEVLGIFGLALLAIAFVYIAVIAFQLVRDGIRIDFVWPHVLRTIAYPLSFTIPLALLFGITLGVGRMANDNELSALRAHGLSPLQLCVPIGVLGLLLAGLTFWLTGWVLPDIHYEQANLRKTIVDQLHHLGSGTNRTILLPGEVTLWVKQYDGPRLRGLVLEIQKSDRSSILPELGALGGGDLTRRLAGQLAGKVTLVAREADLEVAPDASRVILRMRGIEIEVPEIVSTPRGIDVFHQKYAIEKGPLPLSFARRGESPKDLSNPELVKWTAALRDRAAAIGEEMRAAPPHALASLAGRGGPSAEDDGPSTFEMLGRELSLLRRQTAQAESELHGRFAFSFACLTFPLVAFPLVILLERQGRLVHFFLGSMIVVSLFFPLVMVATLAGDRGWPPGLAMVLPNLVLVLVGAPLMRAMLRR